MVEVILLTASNKDPHFVENEKIIAVVENTEMAQDSINSIITSFLIREGIMEEMDVEFKDNYCTINNYEFYTEIYSLNQLI